MKLEELTNGDIIVQMLKQAGVDTVFGIISIHNMPIYDAIARQGGIRAIPTRSEPGAVNMADAYSRVSGKLGVAITSTGAGAGNAAGAIVEAHTAGSMVLHLTGQIDSAYVDKGRGFIHECKDQFNMLKAVSKAAYRPVSAETVPATLYLAIEQAMTAPTGPVSLEIPIDYQKAKIVPPLGLNRSAKPDTRITPPQEVVNQAVTLLKAARRPLIWAGGGMNDSLRGTESNPLIKLAEWLGAGVITSQSGRGAIPENHPLCVGNFGGHPSVRPLLEKADLLIVIGSHLRGNETSVWKLPMPTKIIQIDVDPLAISRSYNATLGLIGDASATLDLINTALANTASSRNPEYLEEIATLSKEARAKLRATLGPYEQIVDDLNAVLPPDSIKVRDVTISGTTWGARILNTYQPYTSIHASGGGIGQGYQMALGAKLAMPDRVVVAIAGDGGFLVNCGELATAVQENIPVVLILFNDGGYGVLRNIQNKNYAGRNIAVELRSPDFLKLAEAFGLWSKRVENIGDFRPTLEEAIATNRPCLVEINMSAIGPFAEPFSGPPGNV